MRFPGDERGQSIQVGAVLLFGMLVISFSTYQAFTIPSQNEKIEYKHNERVQRQFEQLQATILDSVTGRSSTSVSMELGEQYPSRLVGVNPGPVSGALRTVETTNEAADLVVDNANASGETQDFWNASRRHFNTGFLEYDPNYNLYEEAPDTVYENTLVYDAFGDTNLTESKQTLVTGKTIRLVTLNGSLDTTKVGSMSVKPEYVSASTNAVSVSSEPNGVQYEYFEADYDDDANTVNDGTSNEMPEFKDSNRVRTDAVQNVRLWPRDRDDDFAFRYTGTIRVDESGTYEFETESDDGSALYVDGTLVVDNRGTHAPDEQQGSITLSKGVHDVRVEYYENNGGEKLRVRWKPPGESSFSAIPNERLSNEQGNDTTPLTVQTPTRLGESTWRDSLRDELTSTGGTVRTLEVRTNPAYEYYEAPDYDLNQHLEDTTADDDNDPEMPKFEPENLVETGHVDNFDLSAVSSKPENFAYRFNKRIRIDRSGTYTFYVSSDDGGRVYVDGELVANYPGTHDDATYKSGSTHLDAGYHDITVTYYERGGGEALDVEYSGPGVSRQDVPDSVLSNRQTKDLRVAFKPNTSYSMRMAKVGFGTQVGSTSETYLTAVDGTNVTVSEGSTQKIVLEARDRYNNPVSSVQVHANTTREDSSRRWISTNRTGGNGRVVVEYVAPENVDDEAKQDYLNATIEEPRKEKLGDHPTQMNPSTPTNVSVNVTVANADGSLSPPTQTLRWDDAGHWDNYRDGVRNQQFEMSPLTDWKAFHDAAFGTAVDTGGGGRDEKSLRLTRADSDLRGAGVYTTRFDTDQPITARFEYYADGGSGADGLTFFLADPSDLSGGTVSASDVGGTGGDLGYVGMTGGFLGVGFDEYGNFDNEGGSGEDEVTVRGSTDDGSAPVVATTELSSNTVDGGWRTAKVRVDPTAGASDEVAVGVRVDFDGDGSFKTVLSPTTYDAASDIDEDGGSIPDALKVGFSAATGGKTNVHAVNDVMVTRADGIEHADFGDHQADALELGYDQDASSLLGYWPLDEDAGTTANDVSGNGYDGTRNNGDVGLRGLLTSTAYDFANDNAWIDVSGYPDVTSSVTISAWIRTRDRSENGQRIFADDENGPGGGSAEGYGFSLGDPGTGKLRLFTRGVSPTDLDTGEVIDSDDQWYHVAAVVNSEEKTRTIYVDGTEVASDSYSGSLGDDSGVATIGGETSGAETSARFDGQIDEVRTYDEALSSNAVDALYDTAKAGASGAITTEPRAFVSPVDPSTTDLYLQNVDASISNNRKVSVWVKSDTDGDGTYEETSDEIRLDGSGGPYEVTGLSSSSRHFGLRVKLETSKATTGPVLDGISLVTRD